jgi:ParB-like chromosome segregation protein Spo0J
VNTGLSRLNPHELKESSDNPREISAERFDALCHSLKQDPTMLEPRPIIATPDGRVVAGNMRLRAAKEIGMEEVPVFIAELDDKKRREWMLRDNADYGDWVPDDLAQIVAAHEQDGGDLTMLGLTPQETDDLRALAGLEPTETAGGGDGSEQELPVKFAVVIECESEEQQSELLEELDARDLDVRAILV